MIGENGFLSTVYVMVWKGVILSQHQKKNIFGTWVQEDERKHIPFLEFDSKTHRILIQSSELIFCQFLFENYYAGKPILEQGDEEDEEDKIDNTVRIYFTHDIKPLELNVDDDVPDPKDEGNLGEMNNFIYFSHCINDGHEILNFTDENAETAFFKGSAIALAEIPLEVLNLPKLQLIDKSKKSKSD